MASTKPRAGKRIPWRTDPAILNRLPEVERRHLRGQHNTTIAAALGLSEAAIRLDLKRLNELWLERTGGRVEDMRARAVAELFDVKDRALRAAEFDELAERAVLFGHPVYDDDGNALTVQRDDKGSASFRGNKAAALGQARQAVMDAAKLMGLVVDKVAPTDAGGQTLDLAALLALARTAPEGGAGGDGDAA